MSKKKILIIDDDPNHVDLLKIRIEQHHYEVITAFDGKQGIEIARKEVPDVIILDVLLPGINGFEVCKILKKDAICGNIPIMMLTCVYITEEDRKAGLKLGADTYILKADVFLAKPFDYKQLVEEIKGMIEGEKKVIKIDEPEKVKILVVDNDVNNLELLKVRLEQDSFEVETAPSAFAGLKSLKNDEKDEIELLLLDIQMPEKSGIEMLEEVRESYPEVGVVMMTAYETVESVIKTLKNGAIDYLIKPINHRDILKIVQDNLNRNRRLVDRADRGIGIDDNQGVEHGGQDVVNILFGNGGLAQVFHHLIEALC